MGYQTGIAAALRAEGVPVIEWPGWQTRGAATFNPRGLICHHDAFKASITANAAISMLLRGRPDVAGPLCQVWLDDDNDATGVPGDPVAYVLAAGRANHSGKGHWRGLTGNSMVFGIEARNNGLGETWSPAMLDAYVRTAAALCRLGRFDASMVCGHKEFALPKGRKIDPTFDMDWFRGEVAARLRSAPAPAPTPVPPTPDQPTEDDDMVFYVQLSEPASTPSDIPQGGIVRVTDETWKWLSGPEWDTEQRLARIQGRKSTPSPISQNDMRSIQNTRLHVVALNVAAALA